MFICFIKNVDTGQETGFKWCMPKLTLILYDYETLPSEMSIVSLRWRHNDHAGVSNHQPHGCLLNRLFRRKSKKTSKLRITGLCVGNSPGTGEFPAQMASYAENVSIWWRHHVAVSFSSPDVLHPGSLLLTWFNFDPSMDIISIHIHYKVWDEITYPLPNFNDLNFGNW